MQPLTAGVRPNTSTDIVCCHGQAISATVSERLPRSKASGSDGPSATLGDDEDQIGTARCTAGNPDHW